MPGSLIFILLSSFWDNNIASILKILFIFLFPINLYNWRFALIEVLLFVGGIYSYNRKYFYIPLRDNLLDLS